MNKPSSEVAIERINQVYKVTIVNSELPIKSSAVTIRNSKGAILKLLLVVVKLLIVE